MLLGTITSVTLAQRNWAKILNTFFQTDSQLDIRKISYLGWLWPLGFLGFFEPILFLLFTLGPIGTGLAYYLTSKYGGKVTSICCCCGVIIKDQPS